MGCIVIAMPKIEDGNKLAGLLTKHGYQPDLVCSLASEVLSESSRRDNGVIICCGRLKDMSFIEMKECLPKTFDMIILTKNINMDEIPEDAIKLEMPFQVRNLISTIETSFSKYYKKHRSASYGGRSSSEKSDIEKAKAILMERNGMTEPEAHRYIQKNSMDSSRSMAEVAAMIIMLNYDR